MNAGFLDEIIQIFRKYSINLAELPKLSEIFFAIDVILDPMQKPGQLLPYLLIIESL